MRQHRAGSTTGIFLCHVSLWLVLAQGSDWYPHTAPGNPYYGWFGRLGAGKKVDQLFDDQGSQGTGNRSATLLHQQHPQPPPPPPPLSSLNQTSLPLDHHSAQLTPPWMSQDHPTWGRTQPPFPEYHPWDISPNTYPPWTAAVNQETVHSLETQLHLALQHQSHLYSEIRNLTSSIMDLQTNTDIHLDQIHQLNKQVTDTQHFAQTESKRATEIQHLCDSLHETIHNLTCSLELSQLQCANLTLDLEKQGQEKASLLQKIHLKDVELEEYAMGIETARIQRQMEDKRKVREESKAKKKGGFFSWIFSWVNPSYFDTSDEEEDARLEDLARSTLLHALQNERNNVQELETMISTLQQNNSAIADMVLSRDSLIEELNNRVGVFEDDKMVLKAALRQLQNEIKEEAPKTELLIQELDQARSDLRSLESDFESMKNLHQVEMEHMRVKLNEKQDVIDETDSKMNQISIYVDQLEERLASFAIARRDIEAREQRCKTLEDNATGHLEQLERLQSQLQAVSQEKDALQGLTELLVQERKALENKKKKLEEEIKTRTIEGENMSTQIFTLNGELSDMKQQVSDLTAKIGEIEAVRKQRDDELHSMSIAREKLLENAERMGDEILILREENDKIRSSISDFEASKTELEDKLTSSLAEVKFYKAEMDHLTKKRVEVGPQSNVAFLWDRVCDICSKSQYGSSPCDYFNKLDVPLVLSLAQHLSHTKLQLSKNDSGDLVKDICLNEFEKMLGNETVVTWVTELLVKDTSICLNDDAGARLPIATMKDLAMLILTKLTIKMMMEAPPQQSRDINLSNDQNVAITPPPPPPFSDDFDEDMRDISDQIPPNKTDIFQDFDLTSRGSFIQCDQFTDRQNDRLETADPLKHDDRSNLEFESVDDDEHSADLCLASAVNEIQSDHDSLSKDNDGDSSSSFDSSIISLDQVMDTGISSVAIENGSKDQLSASVRRIVPFRTIRKYLSKVTGLHGLITPSSSGRMETVLSRKSKDRGTK